MCSAKDQRSRFDIKVAELRAAQGKNVRMFTDADYHDYVQKVKGDQNTWAQNGSYWSGCQTNCYKWNEQALPKGLKKPKLETQFWCPFLIWIEVDANIQI